MVAKEQKITSVRCHCIDCEDGKRAPMGWINKDGSITFTKRYMGKKHIYTVPANLTDKSL